MYRCLIKKSQEKKQALICLIIGVIAISFAPVLVRISEVGPISTAFWRLAIAFPILSLLSIKQNRYIPNKENSPTQKDYLLVLLSGILFSGDLVTWHLAIQYTMIANATLLANFSPVIIALWSGVVLRKPLPKKLIISLLVALLGIIILIQPSLHMERNEKIGNSLALITACFYAGYLLILSETRKKFTTLSIMTVSSFSCMLTLFILSYLTGEVFLPRTEMAWLILILLALCVHLIGQGLIAYALPYLMISFSSIALLLQPLFASLVSWAFLSEQLKLIQIIGLLIALAGLFLAKQIIPMNN